MTDVDVKFILATPLTSYKIISWMTRRI